MEKTMLIQNDYLHLPVKNGAPIRLVQFAVDDKIIKEFEIELSQGDPDFWVFTDISPFKGKQLLIAVKNIEGDAGLDNTDFTYDFHQGNEIKDISDIYQEELRPQFHFSSKRGWMNDPNGLVYYNGEYHLFYQHNPYGSKWGNMHWGHAVSEDLVHWNELDDALYPDALGTMFSGSGIIDINDTLGLKTGIEDTMVLFYTAAGGTSLQSREQGFTQCIAYSHDRGRTLTKYENNPVIQNIADGNRDPKVFWHEDTKRWIMVLYLDKTEFVIFSSHDLKNWCELQRLQVEGTGECPDLFELMVDGNPENKKWVFWTANGSYLIGGFDGYHFTEEDRVLTNSSIQAGYSYAAQTWDNIRADDNRRIQIAWATIDFPDMPFNGCMTFPIELTLRSASDGIRLFYNPVKEIERLYGKKFTWEAQTFTEDDGAVFDFSCELYDLSCDLELGSANIVFIDLNGLQLAYNVLEQTLSCKDQSAALKPEQAKISLRVLVDHGIVEVFANNGAVYMPIGAVGQPMNNTVTFTVNKGNAKLNSLDITALKSIWK